jgi:hypothetical protein
MTNQPKTLADFLHADSERLKRAADIALVALVISLPWSTSATAIGVVVWLCLLLPTLSWPEMRRAITSPQGGLPLLLVTLGVAGMFWSTARWGERFDGADSFLKLLTIPILFAQFARGQSGKAALAGYLASCLVLLLASYYSVVLAHFYFSDHVPFLKYLSERAPGVPVKDYIAQSGELVF